MKRICSIILIVALVATLMPSVVFAQNSATSYQDYVPGEMPDNMFKTDAEVKTSGTLGYSPYGFLGNVSNTGDWVSRDAYSPDGISGKYLKMTAKGTAGSVMNGNTQTWYFNTYGLYFGGNVIKSNNYKTGTTDLIAGDIAGGKNYVFNIQVKNVNEDYTPNVVLGLYDLDSYASQYSIEYGADGMTVEGSDWMDFKGTITNKSDGTKAQTVNDVDRLSIGLHKSTTYAGSAVGINLLDDDNGMHRAYFAEEAAYDIENNLVDGSDKITTGDVLTFEAALTNQVGLPGGLEQSFVWLAMDTDRQNQIDGITIEPSDDTASATITIEDTLAPGSYDIVAYSETYDMAKGYTITMEAPYYYADNGDLDIEAKLNTDDTWTTEKVTTGLVNYIEVKATLDDNTEPFEWLITDKNRLTLVEDVFSVIPVTTSGAEQSVKVTAMAGVDVKPGEYNVVAVAKDGSVKAQLIELDIEKDLEIIVNTFAEGTVDEIQEGLETTYLSVLGLLDSNTAKADKEALAKIIAGSAEEEKIGDITDVEDIREVLEKLAALSFYNVKPDDMELTDDKADFAFAKELGIDKIDTDDVTLYELYKTAMTEKGQSNVLSEVTGKDFEKVSDFVQTLKESILINAIANPVVNGTGFVKSVLTKENMAAISMDAGNYLDSDNQSEYDNALAGKTLTIEEIEKELAKEYADEEEEEEEEETKKKPVRGGGGGGFSSSVTVPAVDEKQTEKAEIKFADVAETHWAYAEIVFLNKTNVVNGSGDGNFYPEKIVTREEALKMICEAFDVETKQGDCNFTDVDKNAWYYSYVATAKANGIVNGVNDEQFGIGQGVTRQDICVMIMRALGDESKNYPENTFADSESIAPYAKNAVDYLSALFVVNGFTDGTFKPQNQCTKAEIAKIIYNCVHILGEI